MPRAAGSPRSIDPEPGPVRSWLHDVDGETFVCINTLWEFVAGHASMRRIPHQTKHRRRQDDEIR